MTHQGLTLARFKSTSLKKLVYSRKNINRGMARTKQTARRSTHGPTAIKSVDTVEAAEHRVQMIRHLLIRKERDLKGLLRNVQALLSRDDEDCAIVGSRTREERDALGRQNAIELD